MKAFLRDAVMESDWEKSKSERESQLQNVNMWRQRLFRSQRPRKPKRGSVTIQIRRVLLKSDSTPTHIAYSYSITWCSSQKTKKKKKLVKDFRYYKRDIREISNEEAIKQRLLYLCRFICSFIVNIVLCYNSMAEHNSQGMERYNRHTV